MCPMRFSQGISRLHTVAGSQEKKSIFLPLKETDKPLYYTQLGVVFMGNIEILKFDRIPISREQMECMLKWTYGDEGAEFARLWCAFNDQLFDGKLSPVPIYQPTATPFGHWIGQYQGNERNESLCIQLMRGRERADKISILLHEMIHQRLWESGEDPSHNARPWCHEIMRLTKELWRKEIAASPDSPRKVNGQSRRIQKPSPDGQLSITRQDIARWPHSLGLSVPLERFIEGAK